MCGYRKEKKKNPTPGPEAVGRGEKPIPSLARNRPEEKRAFSLTNPPQRRIKAEEKRFNPCSPAYRARGGGVKERQWPFAKIRRQRVVEGRKNEVIGAQRSRNLNKRRFSASERQTGGGNGLPFKVMGKTRSVEPDG